MSQLSLRSTGIDQALLSLVPDGDAFAVTLSNAQMSVSDVHQGHENNPKEKTPPKSGTKDVREKVLGRSFIAIADTLQTYALLGQLRILTREEKCR